MTTRHMCMCVKTCLLRLCVLDWVLCEAAVALRYQAGSIAPCMVHPPTSTNPLFVAPGPAADIPPLSLPPGCYRHGLRLRPCYISRGTHNIAASCNSVAVGLLCRHDLQ